MPKHMRPLLVLTPRWSSAYLRPSRLDGNCLGNAMESKQHPLQREEPVLMQIKQLTYSAFNILRERLPPRNRLC